MRRTAPGDERVEISSADDLRTWLSENHARSDGAWLVTWKKGRGPFLPYADVVRELSGTRFRHRRGGPFSSGSAARSPRPPATVRLATTVTEAAAGRRAHQWRQPKGR